MLSLYLALSTILHASDPAPLYASAQALEATDPVAARGVYASACAERHPASCQRLALLVMLTGDDPQGAIDALAAGCDLGDLRACAQLGSIGVLGVGVLLSEGCRSGDAQQCVWLAERLSGAESTAAYQRACVLGSGTGCWQQLSLQGDDLPAAEQAALRRAACSGGVAAACER